MSNYPQPNSNAPVLAGQDLFRITQPITSAGDIFESEQSAHAIAIGPDSDLSEIVVCYYDDNKENPSRMTRVTVSTDRAYVGTINARNEAKYIPSGVQGRVLFFPSNIIQPLYRVSGLGINDRMVFVDPVLDIIQYFTEQPSLTPARNDKTFFLEEFQWHIGTGTTYMVIPSYGRAYANMNLFNDSGGNITVSVTGVNFTTKGDNVHAGGVKGGMERQLVAPTVVADQAYLTNEIFRAAVNGEYDSLVLGILCSTVGVVRIPVSILMSDAAK